MKENRDWSHGEIIGAVIAGVIGANLFLGEDSSSLGCVWGALTIFGGYLVGKLIDPWLHIAVRPFSEEYYIRIEVQRRQRRARKKRLYERAEDIVRTLAEGNRYQDDVVEILSHGRRATVRLVDGVGEGQVVFDGLDKPASTSYYEKGVSLRADGEGGFKVESDGNVYHSPATVEIHCYIPGEWENHLVQLERKSKELQRQRDAASRKDRKEASLGLMKDRFGL